MRLLSSLSAAIGIGGLPAEKQKESTESHRQNELVQLVPMKSRRVVDPSKGQIQIGSRLHTMIAQRIGETVTATG